MRALLLRVGDDSYAVPIEVAREVLAATSITALPTAPSSVIGLCNVRGEIIPVFDTGVLLGLGPIPSTAAVAILETAVGPAGLATSDMGEAVELGDLVGHSEGAGTAGAFAVEGGLAVLLDVEMLLAPARVAS
ncbi:MAG: purine-binding chemotaxis protein CheW [Actinomycetota bacterium]|jgi:chemotaxis signal transduction protein|nr:purine-binding chemotaxis protein CheW [Actinomycetota bacterium]